MCKALRYLRESQEENGIDGFFNYADQYANRQLHEIAAVLGIQTHLHHHVGRETFATNFIRHGGNTLVLQKLIGHSKVSTTLKCVHVDEETKQKAIDRMDALDGE
ncbi:tyrosine-type recombinase/integrase [Hymenobacter glaciei]